MPRAATTNERTTAMLRAYPAGKSGGESVATKRRCWTAATTMASEPTTTNAMPSAEDSNDDTPDGCGCDCKSSSCTKSPKRATTKPIAIMVRPVRSQARSVRSAAKNTRGSESELGIAWPPDICHQRAPPMGAPRDDDEAERLAVHCRCGDLVSVSVVKRTRARYQSNSSATPALRSAT